MKVLMFFCSVVCVAALIAVGTGALGVLALGAVVFGGATAR